MSPTECVLGAPREGTAYICASRADATRENNYCFASWAFVDRDGADLKVKLSAALISGARATSAGLVAMRDVICHEPEFRGGS